ncbi:hypothetical protein V8E53_002981 [Lactarius tabidus]
MQRVEEGGNGEVTAEADGFASLAEDQSHSAEGESNKCGMYCVERKREPPCMYRRRGEATGGIDKLTGAGASWNNQNQMSAIIGADKAMNNEVKRDSVKGGVGSRRGGGDRKRGPQGERDDEVGYSLISHPHYGFDALARTQSDVDRLRLLREQAAADPGHFLTAFDDKPKIAAEVQDNFDGDLCKRQVIASFDPSSNLSSDGEQLAPVPTREKEQRRRIRLHNKGGLPYALRVYISAANQARDIEDESADVDIATTDGALISLPSAEPAHSKLHSPRPTRSRRPATTATAKICSEPEKCAAMLPPLQRRRSPSQRRTGRRGLSQSSISGRFSTAKTIGTKDERLFLDRT